jgi:hypothetical protein
MSPTRRLAGLDRGAHARRVHALDMTAAIVLGLLLLAAVLGGLVWLDRGPVGQHGRELRRPRPPEGDEQSAEEEDDTVPPA